MAQLKDSSTISSNETNTKELIWHNGNVSKADSFNVKYKNNKSGEVSKVLYNPNAYGTSESDDFGYSVSISGTKSIVGAYLEDDSDGTGSGKAYIFDVNSGNLLHTLDNPNAYGVSEDDKFGRSVSISSDYCIVGAYGEDESTNLGSGKAYIFNVNSGTLLHTLDNPNAYNISEGDMFGYVVSISGDRCIVGAMAEDDSGGTDSGKAYIFDVATGLLLHTLDNPNAYGTSASDNFGISVAIDGNNCIVGAYQEDDSDGTGSGKAYIFDVTTGLLLHTLDNPNAYSTSTSDYFGYSVSIEGNKCIVGAKEENDGVSLWSGKAYIFDVTTGLLLHTLDNPNAYTSGDEEDNFGWSVSISGDKCVVGAVYENDGGVTSGIAYTFDVLTGDLLYTLRNPNVYDSPSYDLFGYSVSIDGNKCIVGAIGEDDDGGLVSGVSYIFQLDDNTLLDYSIETLSILKKLSELDYIPFNSGKDLLHTLDNPTTYGTSDNDYFGQSISMNGNICVVGAYLEDELNEDTSGAAYIFDISTGKLLHTLDNPNAYGTSGGDYFGASIGIDGNRCIVGAYGEDDTSGTNSGKAYIFDVVTGNLIHTLDNPNPTGTTIDDYFGYEVAISGNNCIVGAYQEDDSNSNSGKAYIFDVTTGNLRYTLDNPNAYNTSTSDYFGWQVDISTNYCIVSSFSEDDASGTNSGVAYIFSVNDGSLLHTLVNPNDYGTSASDEFGRDAAIDGDRCIVGAPDEDEASGYGSGKAYIFDVSSGELLHTLDNPNAYSTTEFDEFGKTVSISGNRCIVGAPSEDDTGGTYSGKAYIFDVNSGSLLYTLDNPNAYGTSASDYFGYSLNINNNKCIVGAIGEDDAGGSYSGKIYVFAADNISRLDQLISLI